MGTELIIVRGLPKTKSNKVKGVSGYRISLIAGIAIALFLTRNSN